MSMSSIAASRRPSAFGVITRTAPMHPAGQTAQVAVTDLTTGITQPGTGNCSAILPQGAVGCSANGTAVDAYGNAVNWPPAAVTIGTPSGVSVSPITTPSKVATDPSINMLYNSIAPSIGVTTEIILQAIQNNDDQTMMSLKLAAQQRMAQLQLMSQQQINSGNQMLGQQYLQQAAQLQQFQAQIGANQGSTTALFVIAGIVALGIVGAVVYLKPKDGGRARRNPRRRSKR